MTKLKKIILTCLIFTLVIFLYQNTSKAAANVSVNASKTTLNVDESTTLSIRAGGCAGTFKITTSDSSVVSINGDTAPYLDDQSHSVTLKAGKAGKAVITVTYTVADYETEKDTSSSKSVTITVNNPAPPPSNNNNNNNNNLSGDATLKSITVAGKTFNTPKTDISTTVAADVNSVEIKAVANNGNAKISGTGTKNLSTGTNVVKLTVTAQNGTEKNYIVRIRKLAEETGQENKPEEPNPQEEPQEEPQALRLTYLRVEGIELSPSFDPEGFEYTAEVINENSVDVVALANMEDAITEITGAKELVDGENEILIKLTKGEIVTEYRIILTKKTEEIEPIQDTTEQNNDDNNQGGFWTPRKNNRSNCMYSCSRRNSRNSDLEIKLRKKSIFSKT